MKNFGDEQFIHVVGMYKSGTSWLLHVLASHPEIIAWREFDIIRAVYEYRRSPINFAGIILNRVLRFIGHEAKLSTGPKAVLRDRETIIRNIFCGTGWIPMLGFDKQKEASNIELSETDSFIDRLLAIDNMTLQAEDSPALEPRAFHNTLGVANSRKIDLENFFLAVLSARDLRQVPSIYFNYLRNGVAPGSQIALKAADQLMCIDQLRQVSPKSKKIVIVRDGRDVALSAMAFERLMSKWEAPWTPRKRDYLELLNTWALRVSLLEKEIIKGDLIVIRYEDLKINFDSTVKRLFQEMGLANDLPLIQQIRGTTDFKVVSGGRSPGEEAEHVIRLGMTGEWKSKLSTAKASMAWKMASYELSLLGYRQDGGIDSWGDFLKRDTF